MLPGPLHKPISTRPEEKEVKRTVLQHAGAQVHAKDIHDGYMLSAHPAALALPGRVGHVLMRLLPTATRCRHALAIQPLST